MKQAKYYLFMIAFICLCQACSVADRDETEVHGLKTFFGDNDLFILTVDDVMSDPFAPYLGSIGVRFIFPTNEDGETSADDFTLPYCSGIRLTEDLVLSAAHCKKTSMVFNDQYIALSKDVGKYQFIPFGKDLRILYQGEVIAAYDSPHSHIPLSMIYKAEDFDFAIFKLNPQKEPSQSFKTQAQPVKKMAEITSTNTSLYAYPNGLPLSLTKNCFVINSIDDAHFQHNCDSLQGSSGGLVLVQGKAFGMHLQGGGSNSYDAYSSSGKFEAESQFPSLNKGITLGFIGSYLFAEQIELWREIEKSCQNAAAVASPCQVLIAKSSTPIDGP
ncbi:MAG: trypsin-like serine peptidase [Oligoflexus sp.]